MPRSILVLDRYEPNRTLLSEIVRLEGLEPIGFERVDDFLEIARDEDRLGPAGALVDAWTVNSRMREVHGAVGPPALTIVMTTQASQIGPWLALGASLFLAKPFYLAELVGAIRKAIEAIELEPAPASRHDVVTESRIKIPAPRRRFLA